MNYQIPIRTILFCACSLLAVSSTAQQLRVAGDHEENPDYQKPGGLNGVVPLVLDSFFCSEYSLFLGSIQKQISGYYVYQNDAQQLLFTRFEQDTSGAVTSGFREKIFYNTPGYKTARVRQILIAGEWYDFARDTFIYFPSGELKEVVSQELSGGMYWTNSGKALYSYDNQGKLDTLLGQYWDKTGQTWANGTLTAYDFTANDLPILRRYYVWKASPGQWSIDDEVKNVYHPDGRQLAYYHSRTTPDSIFRLEARDTFLYNNDNLNDSIVRIVWDDTLSQYRLESISAYQYDQNGNKVSRELYQWDTGQLRPKERDLIVPGDNIYSMVPAETVYQHFSGVDSTWKNSSRQKNTFTLLNNQVVKEHYSYEFIDFNQVDWNIVTECDYFYHLKTSQAKTPDNRTSSCTIPNPHQAGSMCRCEVAGESESANVRVFDLMGRTVVNLTQVNITEFELPVLPAGLYVLAIVRSDQLFHLQKILFTGQ